MNKYVTFAFALLFLILVTYIVDVIPDPTITVTGGLDTELSSPTEFTSGGIGSMLGTFWNLMTFNVEGLPVIANLILFYPLAGMVLYMGIDIGKDLIPFT